MTSFVKQDSAAPPISSATQGPQAAIRRATPADADALAAIGAATFAESFGHQYPAADLAAFLAEHHTREKALGWLTRDDAAVWLVEADGEAVGHALAGPCALPHADVRPEDRELKRLYLLPAWQGGGLGRRLMDTALAWAERDGPRPLWIGVWSQNLGALRLYERAGFTRVGGYEFIVGATRDQEFILRRG